MKRYQLLLPALLIGFSTLAQTPVRSGIRGGLSVSNLRVNEASDRNPRYGFHIAAFTQLPVIPEFLSIQPELGYTTKGTTATFNLPDFSGKNTFKLNYLELPVLATFHIGDFVDIHAGPYVGYLLNAKLDTKSNWGNGSRDLNADDFHRFDYGLGAGLTLYFGKVLVGTRYNLGLQKLADSYAADRILGKAKNTSAQVSVGVTF